MTAKKDFADELVLLVTKLRNCVSSDGGQGTLQANG
jgi:hypothetical protein